MKRKQGNYKKLYSGFILPTSLFFMFASAAVIMVYYNWLSSQLNELEYRIAVTKAIYNAESGIAEKAHPYLLQSNYVVSHTNIVMGLVETLVGLVPAGGGCKEVLWRWSQSDEAKKAPVQSCF